MVCQVCQQMLFAHKGRIRHGSQLGLTFKHDKVKNLHGPDAKSGCHICRVIRENLEDRKFQLDQLDRSSERLVATVRPAKRRPGVYHLDFKLHNNELIASLVLKQNDTVVGTKSPWSPVSSSTAAPEVIKTAKQWILDCIASHEKCRMAPQAEFHPHRLLDLEPLMNSHRTNDDVRLVSGKTGERQLNHQEPAGPYVTLSHRWGRQPFLKLTRDSLPMFLKGISMSKLPQTFQDAIKVACDLQIRWLWIDALCIIQNDEGLADWLEESAEMEMIYSHSWCNISATAALDICDGLFKTRDVELTWVDTVTLNTNDLGDGSQGTVSCMIMDPTFWSKYIDDAPVNRRSWVYQERLLSPRVLHWCRNQIAFECRQIERAECWPKDLPLFRLSSGMLVDNVRLKGVDVEAGKQLRAIRARREGIAPLTTKSIDLQRKINAIEDKYHLYELWKQWVQVYSKMELTNQEDRLIALSGIARMLAGRIEAIDATERYIAGMWQNYMASQLLWHVNEGRGKDRQPCENTRPGVGDPSHYRAPSFSWASVETPRGITFADTTDQGLLVRVEVVRLRYRTKKDRFGLLTDGYIVLRGVLRKIELTDHLQARSRTLRETQLDKSREPPFDPINENRYTWRLVVDGELSDKTYEQVWLDSPLSEPSIFGPRAQVYCMPVLRDDQYLKCLIVQARDGEHGIRYQRVGMTRVSTITEALLRDLTTPPGRNKDEYAEYYWGSKEKFDGESTICIV